MWTRWMIGAVLMGIVFSCSAANSIENPDLIGLKGTRDIVSGAGGAFVFNGTTSKAELLFSKTDDITYCVWVRANSSGSVIGRMGYNNALSIQNSQIVFNIFDVNGKWNGTGVACPAGREWIFIAASWNNSEKEMKIYIDGVLKTAKKFPSHSRKYGEKIYIGGFPNEKKSGFKGEIKGIFCFDRVLAPEEIKELYARSAALNSSRK